MRLVLSETDTGVWLQLEGESAEEWARLEALVASGIWTCGPGTDAVLLRLRALAGEIAPGFRHVWGGQNLMLVWTSWKAALYEEVNASIRRIIAAIASDFLDDALVHLRSAQPFGAITAGDLINPRAWSGGMEQTGDGVLRVGTVEHLIHELQG